MRMLLIGLLAILFLFAEGVANSVVVKRRRYI